MNEAGEAFDFDASAADGQAVGDYGIGYEYDGASIGVASFGDPHTDLHLDLSSSNFSDPFGGSLDVNRYAYNSSPYHGPHSSHSHTPPDQFGFTANTPAYASTSTDTSYLHPQHAAQSAAAHAITDQMYASSLGGVDSALFDASAMSAMGGPGFDLIAGTSTMSGVAADLDPMASVFAPISSSLPSTSYQPPQRSTYQDNYGSTSASAYPSLSTSAFGGSNVSTASFGSSLPRAKRPRNRWDVDNLPVAERSLLCV